MSLKSLKPLIIILPIFLFITFLFVYKLDSAYFFTDEILYRASGSEYIHGNFTRNLQHPLIGKYIVGLMTLISESNVFILRLPYALLGVGSAFVVFVILKRQYGYFWGLLGALLYTLSPFIYETTRMVMFEAPMHLFWLLFHFYFLSLLQEDLPDKQFKKYQLLSGLFLGLSIATKIPSFVLYAFSFLIYIYHSFSTLKKVSTKQLVNTLLPVYFVSFITYGLTYVHLLIASGFSNLILVAKETLKVFLGRNSEGKTHIVAGEIFNKSPWWTYFYYIDKEYSIPGYILFYISPLVLFLKKNFFVVYWSLFFILNAIFFQLIPLKNSRYIASIELSCVFLIISLVHYFFIDFAKNIKFKKVVRIIVILLLSCIFIQRVLFVIKQPLTEYNWAFNYFKNETNNFTQYKRMYVFGSIRSLKWYREFVPNESMFLYRQDYNIMCPEFSTFDYIAFEKDELLMDPTNLLMKFVKENELGFEKIEIPNFIIYKKLPGYTTFFNCVNN